MISYKNVIYDIIDHIRLFKTLTIWKQWITLQNQVSGTLNFNMIFILLWLTYVKRQFYNPLQQTAVGLYLENEIFTAKKEAFEMGMRQQKLKYIFRLSSKY